MVYHLITKSLRCKCVQVLRHKFPSVPLRNFSFSKVLLFTKSAQNVKINKENVRLASATFLAVSGVVIGAHYCFREGSFWLVNCDSSLDVKEQSKYQIDVETEERSTLSTIPEDANFKNESKDNKHREKKSDYETSTTDNTRNRVRTEDEEEISYTGSKHIIYPQIKGFDWWQLNELLAPHWHWLTVAIGSALLVSVVNIEIPRLLGKIIDVVSQRLLSGGQDNVHMDSVVAEFNRSLREPAAKIILYYCVQSAATFTYIYSLGVVGERVATELRRRLFSSIINQEIVFFDTHMTGEIINVMTSDIQEFKSSFKLVVSQGLRAISQTVGCMVSLYFVSPQMTQGVVIIVPTVIFIGSSLGALLRKLSRRAQSQLAKATIVGEEAIGNIRTVRAFSMENQEIDMYSKELNSARVMYEDLSVGIGFFQAGSNIFLNSVVLGIIYTGGRLMAQSEMSGGDLMSFMVASQTIQKSLTQLSLLFGQLIRGLEAGTRVFEYVNMGKIVIPQGTYKFEGGNFRGDIEFHNVCFSYPTRPEQKILDNFSLKLQSGQVVALVGCSGCGKSTTAALIERFYVPDSGDITIDGISLRDIDGSWLRGKMIGLINQEPILFATTVMENIRYGNPSATDEEVYDAARKANAFDFVQDFPRGFQTVVGERGVTVSGGQKQRIAIARALIKNPRILILDEATSALDTVSEKIVQETLDNVVQGRTVLIIAHRLSTIKNADKIAVVSNGSIAEIGTHSELTSRKGLYYNLIRQQEFVKNQKG